MDSLSVGTGNKVTGDNSGAFGDPSIVDGTGSYSIGNNNAISNTANNSFVLGGKNSLGGTAVRDVNGVIDSSQPITVENSANNSVVLGNNNSVQSDNVMILGNNVDIKNDVDNAVALGDNTAVSAASGVALGSDSEATRAALDSATVKATNTSHELSEAALATTAEVYAMEGATVADKQAIEATVKGKLGAVSVGDKDSTRQIINVAAGSRDTDAVNVAQLKAVANRPAVVNNITYVVDNTTVSAGNNMQVTQQGDNYTVSLAPDISLNSVTTGPVTMNANGLSVNGNTYVDANGLNANNQVIRNVAAGRIAADSTEAVNGAQLHALNQRVGDVDKRARAGIASAMASAGLPQAYRPGANMVAASAGHYDGQTAIAIGASTISDNGRWILKGTLNVNSKDAGASVGVGYQW